MKKNWTLMALIMMAMAFTFVSCDLDDEHEAYVLEGAWEGDMGVMINGYVADYSTIYFDRDPYRYAYGTGYQVDYFNNRSPWGHRNNTYYLANHITWKVRDNVIKLYYEEEKVYAEIRDYSLSDGYFRGYIDFEDGSSARFSMRKTYSPNNWDSYWEWGWYDDDYYWAKKNTGLMEDTRANSDSPVKTTKIVRSAAVK
jgi:hypothetical protein